MASLHSNSSLTPVSLAVQRFAVSLPLVQIKMPLITKELQWQSRTLLSRERRNARRVHRHRSTQQQIDPPCQQPDGMHIHTSEEQASRQRLNTSTDALSHPIESHALIDLPSTETCRVTSAATSCQGTNLPTDSINIEADGKHSTSYIFDCIKVKEDMGNMVVSDVDSDEDLGQSMITFREVSAQGKMVRPTPAAISMATKVVSQARSNKLAKELEMSCAGCSMFPVLPVTGPCGHTLCIDCIKEGSECTCGEPLPATVHVNTLVQDIVAKMVGHSFRSRKSLMPVVLNRKPVPSPSASSGGSNRYHQWRRRIAHAVAQHNILDMAAPHMKSYVPMSIQCRYMMACRLISRKRYRAAAPHLAHVAASTAPIARQAQYFLELAITIMSEKPGSKWLTSQLYRGVGAQAASSWLDARDLYCVLCCGTLRDPVTTPCGHTFCRPCIERSMDYKKKCSLCQRSLEDFNTAVTRPTAFVVSALESIDAVIPPQPLEPDLIPIFVCTVAYPTIPCPLFMFEPRYWVMVRRVLESESRSFGMLSYERDRSCSTFGTILRVCDCVRLEDGCFILSTVGVSRFKALDWYNIDGCEVARFVPLTDIIPTSTRVRYDMRVIAVQICYKTLPWVNGMDKIVFGEIVATFGNLPMLDPFESDWWETADGPAWMWWLTAILPLKPEIKLLILSTQNLLKRLTAINRTLDAIHENSAPNPNAEEEFREALKATEEWLKRQRQGHRLGQDQGQGPLPGPSHSWNQ